MPNAGINLAILVAKGTDCVDRCKSVYHTIVVMMAFVML